MYSYMKQLLWLFFAIPLFAYSQNEKGIQFESVFSWEQLKEKATREGKFIFVDAYASWCGPCKRMDRDVYPTEAVGKFVNHHFIAVKVQMDTSRNDNALIKQQYAMASELSKKYNVRAFPTYLFFSPEGKIVHRESGYKIPEQFLALVKDAIDPEKQLYLMLEQYQQGKKNYKSMPVLAKFVYTILKDQETTFKIIQDYLYNYFDKLSEAEILQKDKLLFVGWWPKSFNVNHTYFSLLYNKADLVDSIMERKGYASSITDKAIRAEMVLPYLDGKDAADDKTWKTLEKNIAKKYDRITAERIIENEKIAWFSKKKDWHKVIELELTKLDKYGLDTTNVFGLFGTNNFMYDVVLKHATDKKTLDRAIAWMEALLSTEKPNAPESIDTYANLLYKAGYKEKAIMWQEKAVAAAPDYTELKDNLSKMKSGLPTW